MDDFLNLSVFAKFTVYFSYSLEIIVCVLSLSGNIGAVFSFFKHFFAKLRQIDSLFSSKGDRSRSASAVE